MGGINRDVVNKKSFVVNGQDDDPHNGFVTFGNSYSIILDNLGVIVSHRARYYPDTLYIVPIRGVNECHHFRSIRPNCGPKRIFKVGHRKLLTRYAYFWLER